MYQRNVRNVGLKGILIRAWATCGDGGLQRCWYKVLEVSPGGGGVLADKMGRGVRPFSQNPYPTYDQNLRFSLPYL